MLISPDIFNDHTNKMNAPFTKSLFLFFIHLCLLPLSSQAKQATQDLDFAIAQKLMLDLRYYCPEKANQPNANCFKPLTKLPNELRAMLSDTGIGGVILFADNLVNPSQIKQLTSDIQSAGTDNKYGVPLFISVDQEGGRVVRLPMQHATSFSGNMAIGATYEKYGTKFATLTGEAIGKEVKSLGFNVNHAPNVDVNINPDNPVINVRSFSESAKVVAELGNAQLKAMQSQGVIGTLKHFPGHGDTNVDSHTGLPRVNHNITTIKQVDLKPFRYAIDQNTVKMIMTAHIQYPALDSSTLVNKQGESMIKPATMSKTILTDLLRDKMGFDGIVITDALDMKGISDFFEQTEAVIHTFEAGADIALMPIKIKTPAQINKVKQLIQDIKAAVLKGQLSKAELFASNNRIQKLKQTLDLSTPSSQILANRQHKKIESELAVASLTSIKGTGEIKGKKAHFIMPDPNKCLAISQALQKANSEIVHTCTDYLTHSYEQTQTLANQADTIVISSISPKQSLAEIGGMDDLAKSVQMNKNAKWPKTERLSQLKAMTAVAKLQNQQVVFVSLRAPYEANEFIDLADDIITTYSYTHTTNNDTKFSGPAYDALAELFTGNVKASGVLPVTIGK